MKRYTYPAVLYSDGEIYMLVMHDLHLVTSAETVEEAFNDMISYLEDYIDCAVKFDIEIEYASKYIDVAKSKSKEIVLLVSCKVEEKLS